MSLAQRASRFSQRLLDRLSPNLADHVSDRVAQRRHVQSGDAWNWKPGRACPRRRCEAGGIQIGSQLLLIGGFETMDRVHDTIDVFDMEREAWVKNWPLPAGMPHSHHGMASDERRFAYAAAGQVGPQCSPATAKVFSIDAEAGEVRELPSLPSARYAPVAALLGNRLHVVGGSAGDRSTPLADHWSIGVEAGRAREPTWTEEPGIPRAGTHRGHAVVVGALLVFGGQEGDIRPRQGDPAYCCNFETPLETLYPEVYRFGPRDSGWERLADMPESISHIEGCSTVFGPHILIFAGIEARYALTNTIKALDTRTGRWRIVGSMPRYFKNAVVGRIGRTVFFVTGQCSKSSSDRFPGRVLSSVWKARIPDFIDQA